MRHTIDNGYPAIVRRDSTNRLPHSAYHLKKSQTLTHYKHFLDLSSRIPSKQQRELLSGEQLLASLSDVTGAGPCQNTGVLSLALTTVRTSHWFQWTTRRPICMSCQSSQGQNPVSLRSQRDFHLHLSRPAFTSEPDLLGRT